MEGYATGSNRLGQAARDQADLVELAGPKRGRGGPVCKHEAQRTPQVLERDCGEPEAVELLAVALKPHAEQVVQCA